MAITLLAVLALGGATTAMAPAQDTPRASQRQAGRAAPPGPARVPVHTGTEPVRVFSGQHCQPTAADSKERRAGAVKACASTRPAPARGTARHGTTRRHSPTAAADEASCDATPGTYTYTRFGYCVTGINVLYILRDSNDKELGRGTLDISTSSALPKQGTAWDEQITVRMTSASGAVTALTAKFRSSCTAGCTTTEDAPWYGGGLTVGKSLTGTVSYSSSPAPGAEAEFTTGYKMYVTSPGITPVDPNASWDNPRTIRCDDAVGGTSSAGCAVPSVMPVVPMRTTSADPGGAVAAYDWAQKNLDGAWGTSGSPLTRSTSGVADRTAGTCGGFVSWPDIVDADTCGDFPFGEAKEGGTPGARCVDVVPHLGNGEWGTYILNNALAHDPATPCVRAHVTPAERQFAGTQLADGFTDQRVVDADAFELTVSTPDTVPQPGCRNSPRPGDAKSNGDGWSRNTTEPVALVQKTKPQKGAGRRPIRAQACIGKGTAKGAQARGTITGWSDATAFKGKYAPDSKLARCHLIPRVLGGRGTRANLVPCWHQGMNVGTPSMRSYEYMASALVRRADGGLDVNDAIFYQVTPVYRDADSTIPVGVTMNATVQRADGTTEEVFPNVLVTNTLGNTGTLNLGN